MTIWCATCGHTWEAPGPAKLVVWPHCGLDDFEHPAHPNQPAKGAQMAPAKVTKS